jgi:hypothetical protein
MKNRPDYKELRGELIYPYTRARAIADGVVVDLTTASDDWGQVLLQTGGTGGVQLCY